MTMALTMVRQRLTARGDSDRRSGAVALLNAAGLVGIAIASDGILARLVNGIGGVLWFAACWFLIQETRGEVRHRTLVTAAIAGAFLLVVWLRPSDMVWAVVGFSVAGAAVAALASLAPIESALLVPAVWLPVHLSVAIGKAIYRAATGDSAPIRTDPPQTAALVPLVMVIAAGIGGCAVVWWRRRSDPTARSQGGL